MSSRSFNFGYLHKNSAQNLCKATKKPPPDVRGRQGFYGVAAPYMVTKMNFSTNMTAMMVTMASFFWNLPVKMDMMT